MVASICPPKVLVIDDEKLFREMLGVVLKDDYEVLSADSTEAGLRLLRENEPDAVLLDLVMPGRDGIQGLKAIREIDPNVSVIIVTGFPKLGTAEKALELGASAYVEKPIHPEELRQQVRRGIESTQMIKRQATAVQEMTDLIRHLSDDLKVHRRKASQGEMAVELMYDLMYPLAHSLTQLQILNALLNQPESQRDENWQQKVKWLPLVEKSIERCRGLIDICRDLSQDLTPPKERVPITGVVESIVSEAKVWSADVGVSIDFRGQARNGRVQANRKHLVRAIHNLVGQAVESAVAKGKSTVRVACIENGREVEIRVEDNGDGFDLEKIHSQFGSRFGRRDVAQGAGLGFCLTRKIIADHGGTLNIQTAPGKGCVAWMRLPLSP